LKLQKLLRFPLSPATSLSASSSVLFLLRSFARDPTAFFPSPLDRPFLFLSALLSAREEDDASNARISRHNDPRSGIFVIFGKTRRRPEQ